MNHTIIEEVREARAAIAEEHGFDVQRIHEWAKKKSAERAALKKQSESARRAVQAPIPQTTGHTD